MKFSQEQVNDTIIPKVNMSNNKKNKNVGKELVQRTQDLNNNIESIMGKSAKTESLPISDGLVMYLYGAGDSGERYVRVDFTDYSCYGRANNLNMIMDKEKLKEMADFILQYLENK
jgi:hypothetical protein